MTQIIDYNYSKYFPKDKKAKILDLGCGDGKVLSLFQELGFQDIYGYDYSSKYLALMPQDLRSKVVISEDLESFLKERVQTFDFIFLKDVLYYFPREKAAFWMKLIANSLKPGGTLLVEVFNGALLTASYTAMKDPGILTIYTETSIKELAVMVGLKVEIIFGVDTSIARRPLGAFVFSLVHFFWRQVLKFIYFAERGIDSQNPKIFVKSIAMVAHK